MDRRSTGSRLLTLDIDSAFGADPERVAADLESLVDLARMEALSFVGARKTARGDSTAV